MNTHLLMLIKQSKNMTISAISLQIPKKYNLKKINNIYIINYL